MSTINDSRQSIAIWLLICCATIFAMIVLGGVTRLTGSGLSMVQWDPIMGVLPPLDQAEWQHAFNLYQQYPEYRLKNFHMTVEQFKSIFWFEYAHRILGRTIGIIFFIPFMFFLLTRRINRKLAPRLAMLFVLGALQGLMGWYMVKSGLVDNPHVSQYRLTAHLSLAIIIYGYMFWIVFDLLAPVTGPVSENSSSRLPVISLIISFLVFFTAVTGGFVAGTRAGFAFNTFPLMDGKLIPDGLFELDPWWRNFFENVVTVQFDHRVMAALLFVTITVFWLAAIRKITEPRLRIGLHLLLAALALQITLGISTLLLVVPVPLAAAHQGGAVLLLTASLFVSHQFNSKTS